MTLQSFAFEMYIYKAMTLNGAALCFFGQFHAWILCLIVQINLKVSCSTLKYNHLFSQKKMKKIYNHPQKKRKALIMHECVSWMGSTQSILWLKVSTWITWLVAYLLYIVRNSCYFLFFTFSCSYPWLVG